MDGWVDRAKVRLDIDAQLDSPVLARRVAGPASERARERWGTGTEAERGMAGMMTIAGGSSTPVGEQQGQ